MNKKIAITGLLLAGMLGSFSANAAPVPWCGATNPFNQSECTFASVGDVNSLTAIVGPGEYTAYQSNTGGTTFKMDLQIDSNWVTVWTAFHNPASDQKFDIATTIAPLFFAKGALTGIKFYSDFLDPPKEYKSFDMTGTQFTFACLECVTGGDDDTTTVPEPGTLALLGLGLAGLGFSRRRGMKKS